MFSAVSNYAKLNVGKVIMCRFRRGFTLGVAGLLLLHSVAFAYTDVTVQEAKTMTTIGLKHAILAMQLTVHIQAGADLIILDVREESDFCGPGGHIPGAVNYPWNSGARYDGSKTVGILVY
jgi:hypothetical protein